MPMRILSPPDPWRPISRRRPPRRAQGIRGGEGGDASGRRGGIASQGGGIAHQVGIRARRGRTRIGRATTTRRLRRTGSR